ncbi:MAG: glutaredoxin family protein [Candidatus Methylomirabilales bacterium]
MSAPPVRVTLYTKAECPLCEEMAAVVAAVGAEVPLQMTAVDIAGDPELLRRFGEEVPVLFVDGRKAFKYRVTVGSLRRRLWRAQWERRLFGPPPEMSGGGT